MSLSDLHYYVGGEPPVPPGPEQVTAMGAALRAPIAYGAQVTQPGTVIPPLVAKLYTRADLLNEVVVLDQSFNRQWQDQLNESGTASLDLLLDDPDLAALDNSPVIRFEVNGWACMSWLVRELNADIVSQGEEHDQIVNLSGPGHVAVFDEALVYPARGPGVVPIEENRPFNWTSVDYDDAAWIYATALTTQGSPGTWWTGLPAEWPDPTAWWIWANIPGALDISPPGACYFRREFTVPPGTASLAYFVTFDAIGDVYIDGQWVTSGDYGIEPDVQIYSDELPITPGVHNIAVSCANDIDDPEHPGTHNPGGLLFTAYAVNASGEWMSGTPIFHTDGTWRIVEYPPYAPGMTAGEVVRHAIEEAQARGALPAIELAFTDETDSDGNPWPEYSDISTKTGTTDVLTFLRELSATYIDFWLEPGSWRLWCWVKDLRGDDQDVTLHPPTDVHDPWSGNIGALSAKRAY